MFLALTAREAYVFGQSPMEGPRMNKRLLASVCLIMTVSAVFAATSYGQEKQKNNSAHKIVHYGDLKWTPIIKGCEIAVVEGNPDAEGQPFVARFHCTDGAKTPPHWHPTDENLTVLKGAFLVGIGESFDESKLKTMNPGNFMLMPKEMRHFGMARGDLILQVHGLGPFKVNWVNPSEVQPPDAPAATAPRPKF
jgi:quercetin dioxygenase-like cupin family protein